MSIEPIERPRSMVHFSERADLDRLYQHIHLRIDSAKKTMPGIKLEDEIREKDKIVNEFQGELQANTQDEETVKKSIVAASRALKELDWNLDKKITFAQLSIFYFRILQLLRITPAEVETSENTETNEVLVLGRQAYRILEIADEKFNKATAKPELEEAANECFTGLSRLRSTVLKELTYADVQNLIEQVLKQVPEDKLEEVKVLAKQIQETADGMIRREDATFLLSPDKASQVIVEISKHLSQLAQKIGLVEEPKK